MFTPGSRIVKIAWKEQRSSSELLLSQDCLSENATANTLILHITFASVSTLPNLPRFNNEKSLMGILLNSLYEVER